MMRPLILMILDGWGYRKEKENNGIALANTPAYDRLLKEYPWTLLKASGKAVGLPDGVMGNSEVGHMNIGAGRVVYQGLSQIYAAIEDKSFFKNSALVAAVESAKKNNAALHLIGLLSDGAVHSHIDHLFALLKLAKGHKLNHVFVHCLMDGRDTSPTSGAGYVSELKKRIGEIGVGRIATIVGRYWGMDRDKRWEKIERAYDAMVLGNGEKFGSAEKVFEKYYKNDANPIGFGDEFIPPAVITDQNGKPTAKIQDGDAVIFFNFRSDRAREITRKITDSVKLSNFTCMMEYDPKYNLPVAFRNVHLKNILGEVISKEGLNQIRIAETEKYAHVTFFFNGGEDQIFKNEERILIPSPKEVPTYDLKPEMSAPKVTEEVVNAINSEKYKFIVLNFANPDMVGHTAVRSAIIRAIETVDACLGKIIAAAKEKGWDAIVTSDHGNSEEMVDKNGEPHTQHTVNNPVPFILICKDYKKIKLAKDGKLANIAPTILDILGIKKPIEMTEESLLTK